MLDDAADTPRLAGGGIVAVAAVGVFLVLAGAAAALWISFGDAVFLERMEMVWASCFG
jgi:hypothetical protein